MISLKPRYLLIMFLINICSSEDYYELLGVAKNANNREIRKAFKKLAVKLHPDKNKDDPNAQSTFIHLTKAYETLKDEELRKKYDLYGEEGIKENKYPNYHSWSYYHDNFGIYDDDTEIITLNRADFEQSVINTNSLWFINFYSPMCSHCHHLAPEWRQLAREVEGVVRIGAVNCEEDWSLCHKEYIRSYPSLVMYPSKQHYSGRRTADAFEKFVLSQLAVTVVPVTLQTWSTPFGPEDLHLDIPWVVFQCYDEEECSNKEVRIKVAAILEGLVNVGVIDCMQNLKLCTLVGGDTSVAFWEKFDGKPERTIHKIENSDFKTIARQALSFLPEATDLDSQGFEEVRAQLQVASADSWLVYFYIGGASEEDLELRKLPALLPANMRIGRVQCGREALLCKEMHISRYPLFAIFKAGGRYEIYHGRETAHDIANFAEESRSAGNIQALSPDDFVNLVINGQGGVSSQWFVEFYAPWCPPCMRLLPEFRKASRQFISLVNFGTVDCTVHAMLCRQYNIRSYPTTVLYNRSVPHQFYGSHTTDDLVEFVEDILHPLVIKLTDVTFYETVASKTTEEIWLIDFFAPWCGPCQQLSPHWKKLAKTVSHLPNVHVAEVDCQTENNLCEKQGVRSYPTIRLYPFGSKGLSSFAIYSGFQRDVGSLKQWLYNFLPTNVEELTAVDFEKKVYDSKDIWLLDFYAPWCGHCAAFLPEFQEVAKKLEGKIRAGKVNCDANWQLCMKTGISAYPSVVLYQPRTPPSYVGEEIESQSSSFIVAYIERVLSKRRGHTQHDEF